MNRLGRLLLVLLAGVGALAGLAAAGFMGRGISTRPAPSRVEVRLARQIRHRLIPASARAIRNPIPASGEALADGRAHFADHCASCHGNDGKGGTNYGTRMFPRVPDMSAAATQELSDGELFWILENGVKLTGMPGFGDDDPGTDVESWELVHFIRSLPRITAEELAQMERLNPVLSRADVEKERENEEFLSGEDPPPTTAHSGH